MPPGAPGCVNVTLALVAVDARACRAGATMGASGTNAASPTAPSASLRTCWPFASVITTRIKYASSSVALLIVMLPGAVPVTVAVEPLGLTRVGAL
jgi:hypothetical protein